MDRITLRRPDDFHVHLRDGPAMASVLADTARQFARAIVMPNLKPPVTTTAQALHYRDRILGELADDAQFEPLMERFSQLKVVLEHITTRDAVQYVEVTGAHVAATITAHHLLMNRNALFMGGIRPHHYCLPVLKREEHREALVEAATSGNPKFFLGTDSAPHAKNAKEAACGCAGIYTGHAALELYAIAFEEAGALARLEAFASEHGANFYGLPHNRGKVTLVREDWRVPETLGFGGETLVPVRAGDTLPWKLA